MTQPPSIEATRPIHSFHQVWLHWDEEDPVCLLGDDVEILPNGWVRVAAEAFLWRYGRDDGPNERDDYEDYPTVIYVPQHRVKRVVMANDTAPAREQTP